MFKLLGAIIVWGLAAYGAFVLYQKFNILRDLAEKKKDQ